MCICNIHAESLMSNGESSRLKRQNDNFARMRDFLGFRGNLQMDSRPVISLQTVIIDKCDPIFYLPSCAFSCMLDFIICKGQRWQSLNTATPESRNDTGLC